MKKIFTFLFLLITSVVTFAQVPAEMNYQVMVLDPATGNIKTNKEVNVKTELRKGNEKGSVVWQQEFNTTTSKSGICNLTLNLIGVDWNDGPYYMATIVDGTECGSSKVNSIPYALQAASLEGIITKEQLCGEWVSTAGSRTKYYKFNEDGTGLYRFVDTDPFGKGESQYVFNYALTKAGVLAIVDIEGDLDDIEMDNVVVVSSDVIIIGSDHNGWFFTKTRTR